MSIIYHSTRGQSPELTFKDVVLAGLAPDGGLYVPKTMPKFSSKQIESWRGLDYPSLAAEVLAPFFEGTPIKDHKSLINKAYDDFRHADIAPLKDLGDNQYLMELFHGPTLAFKDFALQMLGLVLDELLSENNERVVVLGATSGDTGSAAIAGCRGRKNMDIYILHPHGRVSDVQRRQMTTIDDANVYNIAVEGSFDECQRIVKDLFTDVDFRSKKRLTAVNSINWARIMAQIVYYFYSALKLGAPQQTVSFSVPTGNFGDIYAGFLAKRMGLPIDNLMIASNRNDILTRCLRNGEYRMDGVNVSLSPSMDIEVSSNFERLLFEFYDEQPEDIRNIMSDLKDNGEFHLSIKAHEQLKKHFTAQSVNDKQTIAQIKQTYKDTKEVIDPHTAVGVRAAQSIKSDDIPVITLATAHPAKFPNAVKKAIKIEPELPEHMSDLFDKPEKMTILPANSEDIRRFIENSS